jgi:magnesium chelatase family protein
MFAKINSAAVVGLNCEPVTAEVDITGNWPGYQIIGLPDTAVQEAKERIRTAWKNSGLYFPNNSKIIINLAPADTKKSGTAYDLPMAIGMYIACEKIASDFSDSLFVGELALDGSVRHTSGILPLAIFAAQNNYKKIFVPKINAKEAGIINEIEIYPVSNFSELINHIEGKEAIRKLEKQPVDAWFASQPTDLDMCFIKGQEFTKRALEVAASGNHNVLLNGPPGSGKTLLARSFPSIMPNLTIKEAIEVTQIYSVAGMLSDEKPMINQRPFRCPHHSASAPALVGGGTFPRPGEISLAHRGVLFLDELPEFSRQVLETLRQPLEDGVITISRAQGSLSFPARFTLIASQNPCPCGYATDHEKQCVCSPLQISRYQKKISGPLLDRIDLHIEVPRIGFEKLNSLSLAESSLKIKERVQQARERQVFRFKNDSFNTNNEMAGKHIREHCKLNDESISLMRQAVNQMMLSARSYYRILKTARTIADLENKDLIETGHVAEALQYRMKV